MGGEDRPPSQRHPPSAAGPPERRQWQHIFGALLEMLQQRQRQVETLARDRKFLQDYVHLQDDRWASKAHLLESQISQMRKEEEMAKRVEEAKLGLMVALKQRVASCYKELAEDADNDLQEFCQCVESLSCDISLLKENLEEGKSKEADTGARECCDSAAPKEDRKEEENNALGLTELRKWKQAYKKLSSTKEAEVSALLAEKDFVWHQLKKMESDYAGLLKSKQIEVDQANETLEKLQANVEELRSSTMDKDKTIDRLKDDIRRIELEMRSQTREAQRTAEEIKKLHIDMEKVQSSMKEKDDMIAKLQGELAKHDAHMRQCSNKKSRLSKESTLLTRSGGHSVTPTGRHRGMAASRSSCLPNGSPGSRTARTGPRQCSKRKSAPPMSMVGSPKLFPSTFKVPKLKNLSPAV